MFNGKTAEYSSLSPNGNNKENEDAMESAEERKLKSQILESLNLKKLRLCKGLEQDSDELLLPISVYRSKVLQEYLDDKAVLRSKECNYTLSVEEESDVCSSCSRLRVDLENQVRISEWPEFALGLMGILVILLGQGQIQRQYH